ncbi:prepilin peptidase [Micromonospora arborensis]|uniref:prepilin peptidase n=1 Tax=Micromonospora arborensis TaxID=2116518 RepID=UPI0033C0EFB3
MRTQDGPVAVDEPAGSSAFHNALALAVTPVQRLLVLRLAVPGDSPPNTVCGRCGAKISLRGHGQPALLPPGRCGGCGRPIGAPPYLLELLTVLAAAVAVLASPTGPVMMAALWWVACAVPLVFVDVRVHRLPNVLTYPAAAGVLLFLLLDATVSETWEAVLRSVTAAATIGAAFILTALLLGRRGLGLGDGKLMVSIALLLGWWGWGFVFTAVFVAFLTAGVAGAGLLAARRVTRQSHLPMGPHLVLAAVVVLAVQAAG